jgi:hypothetical protein
MQTYGDALAHEQEVLTLVSDILMHTFISEAPCCVPSEPTRGRLHNRAAD